MDREERSHTLSDRAGKMRGLAMYAVRRKSVLLMMLATAALAGPLPARGGGVPFTEHVISTSATTTTSVFATDLDGDGDIDVLSASAGADKIAWYESDGGSPPSFTEHVISTTADGASSVFATDVDGDGDTDVLSASVLDNKIAWYESDGGSPPTFTEHVIPFPAISATSVFATDLDGDGDTDILSASGADNKIAWYENDGGSPPSFTKRVIWNSADNATSVFATDVDGDGDIDVLSASQGDGTIAWHESDGGSPPSFTPRVISTNAAQANSVFATDVDGDGDTDVLSASQLEDKIAWYENDGGSPPSFTEHVISTNADLAFSVFAADVDGDGDTDVLSASLGDDKIAWYESDGGSPPTFTERVISNNAIMARSVFATDVDGDGDTDVLSASGNKIAWYENEIADCNDNGIPDECEPDCDEDGIPDECEFSDCSGEPECGDCNGNGMPDECDIADCPGDPACSDCNMNGIPDGCEISDCSGEPECSDCNGNGVPDECEISDCSGEPECSDCNGNGVPDECEVPQGGAVTSTWVGGSGLWDTPPLNINWCLPETPDNNVDADFDVIVDGASSSVTLNISPTISALELGTQAMVFVGDASGANSRTLAVDGTITNDGVLRATDRERFVLDAPVIDQIDTNPDCALRAGGVLEATDGVFNDPANPDLPTDKSILEINGSMVVGGFARATDPNSEIHLIGGAELVNVCVEGVVVPDGQIGRFGGTVTNDGVLLVGPDPELGLATLLSPSDEGATLEGNGGEDDCVRLGGQTTALLGNFKSSFTNAQNHRIDGAGIIFGGMTNLGTVQASAADGDLVVFPPGDKVNDGLFLATDGGTLRVEDDVTGSGSYAAEGGTIEILAPVSGFDFTASGGTIRIGSDTQATSGDGDGPVVVEPGAFAPGEIIVTGSDLMGASNWQVGNDQTEAGMSAAMRLLDGSLGMVNGPVLVTQNGTLEIIDSELIAEDLILEDGATLIVGSSISLDGTLFLELTDPGGWSWAGDSVFEMTGGMGLSACNSSGYAELEVGGEDLGDDPDGFDNNFDLAELVIGPDAHVSLVDNVDNGPGAPEALYVDTVTFADADGRLNLNGFNLYYVTLNGSESQIIDVLPEGGDADGDGVCDSDDICPGGDDSIDDDGDGVPNFCDSCPNDNPDDSDGDGVCDSDDICPGGDDSADSDVDGVPDFCDPCPADNPDDTDGDGVCDSEDICPGGDDSIDDDGDGVPNFCDSCPNDNPDDSDGDGVCDSNDICPGGDDSIDSDADGVPDFCDPCPADNPDDTDGDGVCDSEDICPGGDDSVDDDGDGVPNFCDSCPNDNPDDSDGDGVCDSNDICPGGDDSIDSDADGVPDFCDPCPADNPDDTDGDGVCDSEDICPGGDDSVDDDGDGVPNFCDSCPNDNPDDSDGDGVCDSDDPCPLDNPDDTDGDGVCDSADICVGDDATGDPDEDGWCDSDDNCPDHSNPDQADCDVDDEGDVCEIANGTSEDCDGDGVPDECQVEFAVFEWIGPDGGSFTDPANWNPQGVPGGEAALINTTAQDNRSVLSIAGETTICSLTLESTGGGVQTLEIGAESTLMSTGGTALNDGGEIQLLGGELVGSVVALDGGALVGHGTVFADVENSGTIEGSANGDLLFVGDVFSNAPAGTLRAPLGSLVNVQAATVTQSGLIEIESTAGLVVAPPLVNAAGGTISILGGAITADGITNSLDGAITGFGTIQTDVINDGVITVIADMQIVGDVVNDGTIIIQSGVLTITGNISGSGEIIGDFNGLGPGGGGLTVIGNYGASSSATLLLGEAVLKAGGNFDIAIDDSSRFDLTLATLQMVGLPATTQSLETLAEDVGGDVTLPNTALFSLATLRVGPTSTTVDLLDNHDNDGLGQAACEALYVETLIIESGATLNTNDCRVYYATLILDGEVDDPAHLIEIGSPCPADFDGDGEVNAFDLAILLGSWGPCPPEGKCPADFDGDGEVNAFDLAILLGSWGPCE